MTNKRFHMISLLLVCFSVVALTFTAGCISEDENPENDITEPGKILFLDHHINEHGEFIEGDTWPMLAIDFPTYYFDEENNDLRIIKIGETIEVNSSLIMIAGEGDSLSGVTGTGAASAVYGVYSLPYEGYDYEIVSLSEDGTVVISYNNEEIILGSGEKWENIENSIEESEEGQPYAKVNITTTDTFINYGFLEEEDIIYENG